MIINEGVALQERFIKRFNQNKEMENFPKPEDFGLTLEGINDYLYNKEYIQDLPGSKRSQYTLAGILVLIPILIVSAIPDEKLPFGSLTFYFAIVVGLILSFLLKVIVNIIVSHKLKCIYNKEIEKYVEKVMNF